MKTGLFVAALVQLAAAQPHDQLRHAHMHAKRENVVVTQVVTATAPDAVVWVNPDGTPVSTSFASDYAAKATHVHATSVVTQSPVAAAVQPTVAPQPEPEPKHHHHHHHHHHHNNKGEHKHDTQVAASSPDRVHSDSNADFPLGLVYPPYTSDGNCKMQDEVNSDFDQLAGYGYGIVRIYGTDCDQLNTVSTAAKSHNMKLMVGTYTWPDYQTDLNNIVDAFKSDWSGIQAVAIGNELVHNGQASASDMVAAVNSARGTLQDAGYTGSVVTVDVFNTIIANPELCGASDFTAANAHAFFDPSCTASNAGTWAANTVKQLQQACGDSKPVVLTESGWPHAGSPDGSAVPGASEQQEAISSLKSNFNSNLFLFEAYDQAWKQNSADTFGAEQFWGIYQQAS